MLSDATTSNFIATISLFFLYKEKINKFYLFLILIISIGFLHNLVPYTQSIAFGLANFAILFRLKRNYKGLLISYIFIISSIFFRNTYLIIFLLFIFIDLFKLFLNQKNYNFKFFLIIFFSGFIYLTTNLLFENRSAESKYNNGYFNDTKWSPTKSQSNTDIAFILNYNYLYLEKNSDLIENDKKDFYFSNQILFDGAQSFTSAIQNNPNFFIWGLTKNLMHIPAIILNKFTLRSLFPKCSKGHSCLFNYLFISFSFLFVTFFLMRFYLGEYLFKKKFQNILNDDYLIYGVGNLLLILVAALAMPKIRYMVPFLYFLVPLIISCHDFLKIRLKNQFLLKILTIILIFSFSFSQMSAVILKNLLDNIKNKYYLGNLKTYNQDIEVLSKEIFKCKTVLVDTPTLIVSFTDYKEENLKTFFEIPPFGQYNGDGLNLAKNMYINCILFDENLENKKGQNRGTGPNYNYRRENYLFPFLNSNNYNLIETIKFNNIGELMIYRENTILSN